MKPRLSLSAARLFYAIADYVRRYYRENDTDADMARAASDVMDGWRESGDSDVRDLIAAGMIAKIRHDGWTTWYLTPRGCAVMRGDVRREVAG